MINNEQLYETVTQEDLHLIAFNCKLDFEQCTRPYLIKALSKYSIKELKSKLCERTIRELVDDNYFFNETPTYIIGKIKHLMTLLDDLEKKEGK